MRNLRRELILAGAAVLLLAPLAFAQPTDAEFKCEQAVDKAGAKFVGSKSKCISKCLKNFWKAVVPSSDCSPPYGGDTAQCINDTVLGVKGAENKFSTAIKKACDSATKPGTECPQCYDSGDCSSSGFATDQVQNIEGQVDSFVPGVACELGADAGEQKCQLNTAKALAKQVSGVVKCYDKCQSNARKGLISESSCAPPATDPPTAACISKADGKAVLSVDKLCGDIGAIPDCSSTDDYPNGATWVNLVDIAISGNQPATYCASATTSTSTSSTSSSSAIATTSSSSIPTTSSSSSTVPTTSSSSSSTITPTTTTNTTTTGGGGGPSGFDFLSTAGSGSCGNTFRDLAGTIPLKNLGCGNLSLGGGLSQVPDNATPSGATNRFSLSCVGAACNIGATTSGSTPAGVDCTDTGCKFGVPLPISNAGLSVCVTNTFSSPPTGTLNTGTGAATWDFELNSATVLTGNPTQPCPICAVSVGGAACSGSPGSPCTGVCDGSPNQGAACQSKNPNGLSSDCPAPAATVGVQKCFRGSNNGATCSTGGDCPGGLCSQFIGNIAISLSPLTTGTSSLSNASGLFCPGQTASQHGAYKSDICQTGANSGKPCDRNAVSGQDPAHCGAGITCRAGTLTNYCSAGTNNGLGCAISSDCGTGGVCSRAGTLVQLISEVGNPAGALSVGVPAAIRLGSAFCVAATSNPTVNSNANLPASGSTSVLGNVTLLP